MRDPKTGQREPCQPRGRPLAQESPATPVTQLCVHREALPSDPWLWACHSGHPGQRLRVMLPGPHGVVWWEPPAGQHRGSRQLPGRQVLRELWLEPGPAVAKGLLLASDFSYELLWPQKGQREKLSKMEEHVCVAGGGEQWGQPRQTLPCKLNSVWTFL